MRIGFDLRPTSRKNSRRRGVGKYTFWLAEELIGSSSEDEFVFYHAQGCPPVLPGSREWKQVGLPDLTRASRLNWMLDRLFLGRALARDRLDLFHATEIASIPKVKECEVWAHVHDLIPFIFWEDTKRWLPWDYVRALRWAWGRMRQSDLVITDSKHSQKDICERLDRTEETVKVIYPCCDPNFGPRDQSESKSILKDEFSIDHPFLLYVGGSDSRKNLPRLLTAFRSILDLGYPGKLVLAGETFLWDIEEVRLLRQQIDREKTGPFISFPGYVSDRLLPHFYSACDLFIFPSLYEGFGLPVLEAIRCEAMVLASRSSSIPEVAGAAAEYFDPEEADSIVEAFGRVYENPARRLELRRACRDQGRRFSWKNAVRQVHDLYDSRR